MQTKLFHRDFLLVVIGQIISLFGNAILRYAMPLYLLDQTGSAALYGAVSACAFLPMILLSPVGGILADRLPKAKMMVALDAITCAVVGTVALLLDRAPLVPLLLIGLMLLYGIAGAYQPTVQASLPLLAQGETLMPANAIINQVSSLAGILGPVLGGMLYGSFGLRPVLWVAAGCFFASAGLECFIRIPHARRAETRGVAAILRADLAESFRFLRQAPVLVKGIGIVCAFNLFCSAMLIIALPVVITQQLGMSSQLFGLSQGAMAVGGLLGGLLTGALYRKLSVQKAHLLLLGCGLLMIPMGVCRLTGASPMAAYLIFTLASMGLMALATLFSVVMLTYVQTQTPSHIVGKVVSCVLALSMCAQPVGQAMYGVLFEHLPAGPVILFAAGISCLIALASRLVFRRL